MEDNVYIIALEGIDGAGKSTLITLLQQRYSISLYQRTKKGKIIDRLVRARLFQMHTSLQIPIYLLLSYKNYILFLFQRNKKRLVIMDRCFLSNICYFFPNAIGNQKILNLIMRFEVPLYPQKIFILDVQPEVGQKRDENKKKLEWLTITRDAYNLTEKSPVLAKYNIQIIEDSMSPQEKCNIISKYIDEILKYKN